MPDNIIEALPLSGIALSVGTGLACDPVQIEYITLNYLGVAFGALGGLLSVIFYVLKIYKTVQNKANKIE